MLAATTALGGLGLFVLGMVIMTQGLRELAGNRIRTALMRFTATPLSGAITGAAGTAILQSSSVTTVAAVGFVGAGLMSFDAALGVIFGANMGTTITGWLVALLGFKLKLALLLMPLILVGALLRMFANGNYRAVGFALAGFGLIFAGILGMQQGMAGFQGDITPDTLPQDSFTGRLLILFLGLLVTLITQSSSAGIAATMTALYSGLISFEQGLALIIGMDIGTTVTALIAAIGGTTNARRTGYSHTIYNLMTAVLALLLIDPYLATWRQFYPDQLSADPEIALVMFHSLFNTLGLVLVLPFTGRFAQMMKRMVPNAKSDITAYLDIQSLQSPPDALNAVQKALTRAFEQLLGHIQAILAEGQQGKRVDLLLLQQNLDEVERYLDRIRMNTESGVDYERLVEAIQCLDHLQRLHERCEEDEDRAVTARSTVELANILDPLAQTVIALQRNLVLHGWQEAEQLARQAEQKIIDQDESLRDQVTELRATGQLDTAHMTRELQAIRWTTRVAHHLTRISGHLRLVWLSA